MGDTNHGNPDAVRNAIASHNTMLISLPREVAMRAGIERGVQVRVGQDIERPTIITMEVINPADLSAPLKEYLDERKAAADKRDAKAQRKADHAEKLAAAAKVKEANKKADAKKKKAAEKKLAEKEEAEPESEPAVEKPA